MAHWNKTIPIAHLNPSSRLIEAIAATHGVYSRENVRSENAASGEIASNIASVEPNNTDTVDTTLSLAMNPAISDVVIRQSPNPCKLKIGARNPAIVARIESCDDVTGFIVKSNVCKNHTTIDATKIIVNALCKKSLVLSQSKCPTFLAPGIR